MYDVLLIASLVLFVTVALWYVRQPYACFIHPASIYLAFHGFIFVIRPIFAWVNDFNLVYRLGEFQPSMSDKITVILAANLGFLAFMGTSALIAKQPFRVERDGFDEIEKARLLKPFVLTSILLAPVGIASIIGTWSQRATNYTDMVRDPTTGVLINASANGWYTTAQLALVPLVVICAWLLRFRWYSLIPYGLFFFAGAGTGGRGPFVVATLALIILFLIERRRTWPEWRAMVLIAVTAVSFNLVVADRGQAIRSLLTDDRSEQYESVNKPKFLEHMDFANLEYFEFLVYAIPQRTGTYDYFLNNLQIFTEPVPRIWWSGKPAGAPIQLFNLTDHGNQVSFTWSVPGMGWYSLGYLGVIIQCAGFAAMYGLLYRWLMGRSRQSNFSMMIYAMMLGATVITYRDGTLLTVVRSIPFYLGPIGLMWLSRKAFALPEAKVMRQAWLKYAAKASSPAQSMEEAGDQPRHLTPRERRRILAAQLTP